MVSLVTHWFLDGQDRPPYSIAKSDDDTSDVDQHCHLHRNHHHYYHPPHPHDNQGFRPPRQGEPEAMEAIYKSDDDDNNQQHQHQHQHQQQHQHQHHHHQYNQGFRPPRQEEPAAMEARPGKINQALIRAQGLAYYYIA